MKHMILSFKMKVDVTSDQFLMLWFQKYSLDTVSLRTFRIDFPKRGFPYLVLLIVPNIVMFSILFRQTHRPINSIEKSIH